MKFLSKVDGAKFSRGDKVKLVDNVGSAAVLNYEVLSSAISQDGSIWYKIVELTFYGKPNEYRKSVVKAEKIFA